MKIISQKRNCITDFENGVWMLEGKQIILLTSHQNMPIIFSEYNTEEEAKKEFETFMNHAQNTSEFSFSRKH